MLSTRIIVFITKHVVLPDNNNYYCSLCPHNMRRCFLSFHTTQQGEKDHPSVLRVPRSVKEKHERKENTIIITFYFIILIIVFFILLGVFDISGRH